LEIATPGEAERVERIGSDFLAGRGHAGRVRQGEISLGDQRLGGGDRRFARNREFVVIECGLAIRCVHVLSPIFGGLAGALAARIQRQLILGTSHKDNIWS
jgi:hypothetical protein